MKVKWIDPILIKDDKNYYYSPLLTIIVYNRTEIFKLLIKDERLININFIFIDLNNGLEYNPLLFAICYKRKKMVKYILNNKKVKINYVTKDNMNAFILAIKQKEYKIARLILKSNKFRVLNCIRHIDFRLKIPKDIYDEIFKLIRVDEYGWDFYFYKN